MNSSHTVITGRPAVPPITTPGVAFPSKSPTQPRWRTEGVPIEQLTNSASDTRRRRFERTEIVQRRPATESEDTKRDLRFYYTRFFQQRIEDMPSWLISMIVHVILLLVIALISTSSGDVGRILLVVRQAGDPVTTELVAFSIEPITLEELPSDELQEATVDIEIPTMDVVVPFQVAAVKSAAKIDLASFTLPSTNTSFPGEVAAMFSGRTGALKQKLLREAGGTKETENAVSLGLEWLKRQQLRDGSWSLVGPYTNGARHENKLSATAMAMIAFMGSGSTHRGGKYKSELLRSVRWLVKQQDSQGFMASDAGDHEKMYAQAQAMIALCELYAMTGDSWIRPFAQASCDFACRAQSPEGGWRYRPRFDSDTSVTGWFVMGLKSGEAAGLEVDPYVWPNVARYLDSVSSEPRDDYYAAVGYSYKIGEVATPSMTAEGLLCRQYMDMPRNMPGMAQGLDALVQNHPISFRKPDVYYWYYATQSLHHYGGPLWDRWNDRLKVELPAQQELRGRERGSWSPQNDMWGRHAGRLYTTCFSLYCLEVYYRHMPLYESSVETVAELE